LPRSRSAEPFARASIDTDQIVPGQQVHLTVDVLVPDFFTSPPQFPLFDIPNAVVTLPEERAQNVVETIDGTEYSGIRRRYAIVPEIAGSYALPPAAIELGYSRDGKPTRGEARLPALRFQVGSPAGAADATLAFAARGLTLDQSFDRDPLKLQVGQALVRTVTVFAEDTQAMMIPAIDEGQAEGLKQYAEAPRIEDNVSVGRTTGSRRTETITYTADAAGSFELPAVTYAWFDTEAHATQSAELPAVKLTVTAAPPASQGIVPQLQAVPATGGLKWTRIVYVVPVAVVALVIGWVFWRWFPVLRTLFLGRRAAYANSRAARLKQLDATIRSSDDPRHVYAALADWSRFEGFRTISDWLAASGDPELTGQVSGLEAALFSGAPARAFDRKGLQRAIAGIGQNRPAKADRKSIVLPALNPS
jgi:hypothetical protein